MLCRYKLLPEGKRQIIGFQVAGNLFDLGSLLLGRMDYSVAALSSAKVAALSHGGLRGSIETHPWIGQALWQDSAADAAISREWLVNTGRRSAYQRMAHMLCELRTRLDAVGEVWDGAFAWPVTQAEVADALGLSAVHVNRMSTSARRGADRDRRRRSEGFGLAEAAKGLRLQSALSFPGVQRCG